MSTGGLVPLESLFDDEIDLVLRELGEDWQRDAGSAVSRGVWHWTGDASQPAPWIAFLLMNGDRVMAFGVDSRRVQEFQQRVAMLRTAGLNDVEVEDVAVAGNFLWKSEVARTLEALRISRRAPPALTS
jgi:hypothetical protein